MRLLQNALLQYSPCSLDPSMHSCHITRALVWKPLQGTKLFCLVTEEHWSEQLVQGRFLAMCRPGIEPTTFRSLVQAEKELFSCISMPEYINPVVLCVSDVRHRAVLKVIERDEDDASAAAAALNGSPRSVQPMYDVMSQSVPTEFVFNSPSAVNQIYNSRCNLHTDVR